MHRRLAAVLSAALLLAPAVARADQLQCNSEEVAKAAVARLAPGTVMIDYCSNCEDARAAVVRVSEATVVKDCNFEVQVKGQVVAQTVETFDDGKGVDGAAYEKVDGAPAFDQRVDLAYVYVEVVPDDFRWLGGELHLDAGVGVTTIALPDYIYGGLGDHPLSGGPRPEAPTPEAVKKVWAYYYHGQGGAPVLADFVPCLEVDTEKGSPTQYECVKPVTGPVPKDTKVSAWTAWLVPEGDEDTVMVQWIHEGIVRTTRDVKISGSGLRYRTYSTYPLSKPGRWDVVILSGSKEIARKTIDVQ